MTLTIKEDEMPYFFYHKTYSPLKKMGRNVCASYGAEEFLGIPRKQSPRNSNSLQVLQSE